MVFYIFTNDKIVNIGPAINGYKEYSHLIEMEKMKGVMDIIRDIKLCRNRE